MKSISIRQPAAAGLLALSVLSIALLAAPDAHARISSISRTRNGDSATRSVTRTGPHGRSIVHNGSASYDPASKTFTRSSSTTGPNGGTTSSTGTIVGTGNGTVRTTSFTGLNGQTHTEQVTRTRTTDGE